MKPLIRIAFLLLCLSLLWVIHQTPVAMALDCIDGYTDPNQGICYSDENNGQYYYDPVGDPDAKCIIDSLADSKDCMATPPGEDEPEQETPAPPQDEPEPASPADPEPEPEPASSPCKEGYLLSTDGKTCYVDLTGQSPDTDYNFYDLSEDPDGKCLLDEGESTSGNAEWDKCVTEAYTSPLQQGAGQIGQACRNVPSDRYLECMADPSAYHKDPCFSPNTALTVTSAGQTTNVYDSTDCKVKRGQAECEKNKDKGWVYVRAFGQDPETSCVSFIGFTKTIINYALLIAALIAGAMLLKGGFKYVVSRGSATGLMEARDEILHASIGIVLLAVAYVAILFLQGSLGFLGVDLVGPFALLFAN